jgi:predicted amidohydrolase YtcJ
MAVGGDRDVRSLIGPGTRHIHLHGRSVTPGFQDAHVHPTHGGLGRIRCGLYDRRGRDAYLEVIAAYAAAHPDEPWITGGGWGLVDALTAFTAGSAYANHLDETGTLAVGKLADLAILDRDLFDPGQGAIGETTVLATFVEGVAVHEVPGLDG